MMMKMRQMSLVPTGDIVVDIFPKCICDCLDSSVQPRLLIFEQSYLTHKPIFRVEIGLRYSCMVQLVQTRAE